jgi:hypothetical protein
MPRQWTVPSGRLQVNRKAEKIVKTPPFLRKTPRFSRVNRKAEKIVKTPPFLRYILKLTFFRRFCPVFLLGHFNAHMNSMSGKQKTLKNSALCLVFVGLLQQTVCYCDSPVIIIKFQQTFLNIYFICIFNIHIYLFSSTELDDDETLVDKVGVLLGGDVSLKRLARGMGP